MLSRTKIMGEMLLKGNMQPKGFEKGWPQARHADFDESESTYALTWA